MSPASADDEAVVDGLRRVGMEVSTIYDLVNSTSPHPEAIPVLLELLPKVHDIRTKEGIIRALTTKEARGTRVAETLISEFCVIEDSLLKWTIGNALSVVADDTQYGKIVELVRDRRHGNARQMLVLALAKMKTSHPLDFIVELLDDDEVSGHAVMALGTLKNPEAIPHLQRFLNHPKPWIQQEARRGLGKIERAIMKTQKRRPEVPVA